MTTSRRPRAPGLALALAVLASAHVAGADTAPAPGTSPAPAAVTLGASGTAGASGDSAAAGSARASMAAPGTNANGNASVETHLSPEQLEEERRSHEPLHRIIDRPHTVAELEGGIVALPNAPISPGQRGGDTPIVGKIGRGDATLQTGLHVLYRWNRSAEIGAGAIFAPRPTADSQYGGLSSLQRTHARTYLFLGGEGRYIPVHYNYFEAWVGVSGGAIIVADRFTTEGGEKVPTILGTPQVTVRTEGFAVGLQVGGSYYLSENIVLGATFRGYEWILPDARQCSAIGDCATLSGVVTALELGLTFGYRLAL